jgi:DNA repair exonuclease SbcCD ATPase subunit
MIKFSEIKYKNFLSCGNNTTTIQLDKCDSTLVLGTNGAGKSTILDALSFALFGKAHRNISKTQLVNSINNKQCEVQVKFSIGDAQYRVLRGIKPNAFEIYKHDKLINQQSHARDYQKILENNILKVNHKSFNQVVVLGTSNYVPFMELSTGQRRAVIEDLLDIRVFSDMNTLIKEKVSILKHDIQDNVSNMRRVDEKIKIQKEHINKLKSIDLSIATKNQKKVEDLNSEQELLKKRRNKLHEAYTAEYPAIKNLLQELNKINTDIGSGLIKCQHMAKDLVKREKFLTENDSCPTCSQNIAEEFKMTEQVKVRSSSKVVFAEMTQLKANKEELAAKISAANEEHARLDSIRSDIRVVESSVLNIERELQRIGNPTVDKAVDSSDSEFQLAEYEKQKSDYKKTEKVLSSKKAYTMAAVELLKDTGIKTKVVKQYLPAMNKMINQYLHILDFFVSFALDDSFNETIKSRHRDIFSYASFSEGEKHRINLALLFTWRQIAKMKNSVNTNLLILDEVCDSSIDGEGIDNLHKILYTLKKNTNVFIISHKQGVVEGKFDRTLSFEKRKNFSHLSETC